MRLSVSALRDYQKCGHYYKLKRIDKVEERKTHHMAAGSLMHDAFYMAYGQPVEIDNRGSFSKAKWEVTGDFRPNLPGEIFDAVWWNDPQKLKSPLAVSAYEILKHTLEVPENFSTGQKKALKADSQEKLRAAWYEHYREMLDQSMQKPLALPVKEIERPVTYKMGSQDGLAYIDLVLADGGEEVYVDLKSGYTRPNDLEVFFDEQMQFYYTTGPKDIWYYHMRSGEIIGVDPNFPLQVFLQNLTDQTAELIEQGVFPKRFSKDCIWCPFRTQCIGI